MASSSGLCSQFNAVPTSQISAAAFRLTIDCIVIPFYCFTQRFKFGGADPAQLGPVGKPLADDVAGGATAAMREPAKPVSRASAKRQSLANGVECEELFALEAAVIDREIDAMRSKPGWLAAQSGQLRGQRRMPSSCCTPASLVWRFSRSCRPAPGRRPDNRERCSCRCGCRARREPASSVAIWSSVSGVRSALVEGFDKRPLDARHIEGQALPAARKLRIGGEPLGQLRTQIAQRKRAAGMRGEIGDRQAPRRRGRRPRRAAQENPRPGRRARGTNIGGCRFPGARRR